MRRVERAPISAEAARILIENHGRFLGFLQKRLGDRALAEEILQDAFVRGIERGGALRDDERATAWFFRLLRNALADHARRQALEGRTFSPPVAEPEAVAALDQVICSCVKELLTTLKPEYAVALRRVDLDGTSVSDYAVEIGITANNASVRLHRARQALHAQLVRACGTCTEHGCLDCHCKEPEARPSAKA